MLNREIGWNSSIFSEIHYKNKPGYSVTTHAEPQLRKCDAYMHMGLYCAGKKKTFALISVILVILYILSIWYGAKKKKIITYVAVCVRFYVIHSMSFWDSPFIILYTRQFYYSYSRMWVEAAKLYFTSFILFCVTSEVCLKRFAFWN